MVSRVARLPIAPSASRALSRLYWGPRGCLVLVDLVYRLHSRLYWTQGPPQGPRGALPVWGLLLRAPAERLPALPTLTKTLNPQSVLAHC